MLMRNEPSLFKVQSQQRGWNPEAMMRLSSTIEIMTSALVRAYLVVVIQTA